MLPQRVQSATEINPSERVERVRQLRGLCMAQRRFIITLQVLNKSDVRVHTTRDKRRVRRTATLVRRHRLRRQQTFALQRLQSVQSTTGRLTALPSARSSSNGALDATNTRNSPRCIFLLPGTISGSSNGQRDVSGSL